MFEPKRESEAVIPYHTKNFLGSFFPADVVAHRNIFLYIRNSKRLFFDPLSGMCVSARAHAQRARPLILGSSPSPPPRRRLEGKELSCSAGPSVVCSGSLHLLRLKEGGKEGRKEGRKRCVVCVGVSIRHSASGPERDGKRSPSLTTGRKRIRR